MVPLVIPLVPMVMPMVPFALHMVLLVPLVSQWCHWLPMIPLVKLPMVPLGEPRTEPISCQPENTSAKKVFLIQNSMEIWYINSRESLEIQTSLIFPSVLLNVSRE